ncbi:MAG: hypothetical protein IMW90_22060 [Thermogemmatispora sp.]|uniref:hypothetical protein n=1 Tax=Thermogemmatispora sp. TaxID=1968838 RepID=UPI0019FB8674|nr:hypothetical protein [Thermogemmatispora sp.]MBE3568411.1 hypothetical protein [Thermogemmatispora sp.]
MARRTKERVPGGERAELAPGRRRLAGDGRWDGRGQESCRSSFQHEEADAGQYGGVSDGNAAAV